MQLLILHVEKLNKEATMELFNACFVFPRRLVFSRCNSPFTLSSYSKCTSNVHKVPCWDISPSLISSCTNPALRETAIFRGKHLTNYYHKSVFMCPISTSWCAAEALSTKLEMVSQRVLMGPGAASPMSRWCLGLAWLCPASITDPGVSGPSASFVFDEVFLN